MNIAVPTVTLHSFTSADDPDDRTFTVLSK